MPVWNGIPGWWGNKRSRDALDELQNRRNQSYEAKVKETTASMADRMAEVEKKRDEYVRQLQQQYQLDIQNQHAQAQLGMQNALTNQHNSWYLGTAIGTGGGGGSGGYGISTITYPNTTSGYVQTGGTTVVSTGLGNWSPGGIGTIYTSPGVPAGYTGYPVGQPLPNPVTPPLNVWVNPYNPNPSIGDRIEYEYDGMQWTVRREVAGQKITVSPLPNKADFSLDELDEAQQIIEQLSGKEKQLAEANP